MRLFFSALAERFCPDLFHVVQFPVILNKLLNIYANTSGLNKKKNNDFQMNLINQHLDFQPLARMNGNYLPTNKILSFCFLDVQSLKCKRSKLCSFKKNPRKETGSLQLIFWGSNQNFRSNEPFYQFLVLGCFWIHLKSRI